ncbi:purple acid phosphatase 2-like isoform X2 [Malus domestica]|uniref:purple acid phosphatase 2-like isoform X2 n=1 Tax=Malus domestica TaxID=3750 RepID=UPI003974A63C
MKSILPQKSVKPNLLSLIVTGIMSHMKYLGVLPPFGIRSRELRHTSWSCLLIRTMERVSNVAYNIVNGICKPVKDQYAPVYTTIGDGGNLEGLATNMKEPQPDYSAYKEASFGHATFDIKNRTHAYYSWLRSQDGYVVKADSMWFFNKF